MDFGYNPPSGTRGIEQFPTATFVRDLQDAVAALEGGHAALAVPSGLTATTLPLLALLQSGDHLLTLFRHTSSGYVGVVRTVLKVR